MLNYQISYNGVTVGPGTEIRINSLDGLRTMPELRTSDYARLKHHGAYSGVDVLEGRIITITMTVIATSAADFDAQVSALEAATVPLLTGALPMSYQLPGEVARRVNARARKRALLMDPTYNLNWAKVTLEFFCPDPRIYSDALHSGSGTVVNAGNFESRPVITVTGATTLANANDSGNSIVVGPSNVGGVPNPCVIDLQNRTVVDGGGANRFDVIQPATTWFVLVPGSNTISGGGMISWRDAWI